MLKNQINLNFILGGVILVILAIVIYATVATYKKDPDKKQYESEIKALKDEINTLKVQVGVLEKEYELISTRPEKERIINIQTKYAKDSIFIRYAPVSVADSIIRTKLNSIR